MLMDEYLDELKAKWDFTTEQLDHIKSLMVNYACATNMDSVIRNEMTDLANDESAKTKSKFDVSN